MIYGLALLAFGLVWSLAGILLGSVRVTLGV